MPLAAPVITATWSLNSFMVSPPVVPVVTTMSLCVVHTAECGASPAPGSKTV